MKKAFVCTVEELFNWYEGENWSWQVTNTMMVDDYHAQDPNEISQEYGYVHTWLWAFRDEEITVTWEKSVMDGLDNYAIKFTLNNVNVTFDSLNPPFEMPV